MKHVRKFLSLLVMCTSISVSAYQACDAAEDAASDLSGQAQLLAFHNPTLSKPALPDDDADENIPNITRALLPSSINLGLILDSQAASTIQFVKLPFDFLRHILRNHSPPFTYRWVDDLLVLRHLHFSRALRALAPPAL